MELNTKNTEPLPFGFVPKLKLRDYQKTGVRAMALRTYMGNFDSPGLGKSSQALCTAGELICARQSDAVLIITKRSLIDTWKDEVAKHTNFIPYVISGRAASDRKNLPIQHKVYLINYELFGRSICTLKERRMNVGVQVSESTWLKGDGQNILNLARNRRLIMVCDESQAMMTPDSKTSRALHALGPHASHRYILTATPAADKPENVWSQIYFLDQGQLLGRSYPAFMARYAVQHEGKYGPVTVGYRHLEELHKKLRSISVRRLAKDCLDLPPQVIKTRRIKCEGKHAVVMRGLAEKAMEQIEAYSDRTMVIKAKEPLARTIQSMQRASVAPWLIDEGCKQSCKMDVLLEMMDEYPGQILVWCIHRDVSEAVTDSLNRSGIRAKFAHGGLSQKVRTGIIDEFAAKKFRTLVATIASLKEGVNKLVAAQNAIYLQQDWSLLAWVQSQGRLQRMGQTGPVVFDNIIMEKSLDWFVRSAVENKEANVNAAVDGTMISLRIDKVKFKQCIEAW